MAIKAGLHHVLIILTKKKQQLGQLQGIQGNVPGIKHLWWEYVRDFIQRHYSIIVLLSSVIWPDSLLFLHKVGGS